jgi:hypothetical protein
LAQLYNPIDDALQLALCVTQVVSEQVNNNHIFGTILLAGFQLLWISQVFFWGFTASRISYRPSSLWGRPESSQTGFGKWRIAKNQTDESSW